MSRNRCYFLENRIYVYCNLPESPEGLHFTVGKNVLDYILAIWTITVDFSEVKKKTEKMTG